MSPLRSFALLAALALLAVLSIPIVPALADEHGGAAAASTAASLEERLAAGDRAEADKQRDAGRKPAGVIAFLGVEPGMTVLDLIAAGGYYTEVLSLAVGPSGKVYAQNPPFVLQLREGANEKALTERLAGGRLVNVQRLDQDLADVDLAPGSIDVAITALNFHDIYHAEGGEEAARGFLARVLELLEPGGVLGLIDHSGAAGNDNAALHRIEEAQVAAAVKQAGFEVVGTSDLLRNPADDRSAQVFDPAIRGQTDRFLLKLRKPE